MQTRQSQRLICRFCGSDKGFDQLGTFRVEAWRKVSGVSRDNAGKLSVTYEDVESESSGYYDAIDFDGDVYRCIECDREETSLEALIGDPVMFEPGARVVCPDGFKGVVETVDFEARRLTVEGWHEEFKFAEVDVVTGYA